MADGGIIYHAKEKDKGTDRTTKISFMIVHYVENKSFIFVDKNQLSTKGPILSLPWKAVPRNLWITPLKN